MIAMLLLVLMVLMAAAINVPWALQFMHSRTTITQVPTARVQGGVTDRPWPAATPHADPWPSPDHWTEGGVFGCRYYDVRSNEQNFAMVVQHLGWPLPVIEVKQMWWDWNDPALAGPESDAAPSLMIGGLLLNPLILGGGAWLIFIMPWIAAIIATRAYRKRRNRCLDCGYPNRSGSERCTECGGVLSSHP